MHVTEQVWTGVTHSGDHFIEALKIHNNLICELYSCISCKSVAIAVCINKTITITKQYLPSSIPYTSVDVIHSIMLPDIYTTVKDKQIIYS